METKLSDAEAPFYRDAIEIDRLRAVNAQLLAALQDADMRATQAIIASDIGRKAQPKRADFLYGEMERLREQVRAAIAKAKL